MATTLETAPVLAVPFLDLKQQSRNLGPGLQELIRNVLDTACYIQGPYVAEFERAFAEYCGVKDAIAVDSGTAALHLALLAMDIGNGDEVVVPTNTFIATAAAVHATGATPVFVDAEPESWQMDLNKVANAITSRCRAVIGVHLYGQPFSVTPLLDICGEREVPLIEDAAQAHGARFRGRRIGSFGRVACFSFYPSKNFGAFGDGGAITTNDLELATRIRRLRDHGRATKYDHQEVGFNYRMDEIQGAVLKYKLGFLDDWNHQRQQWAARYRGALTNLPICLPGNILDTEPVHHLFPVCVDQRDGLAAFLDRRAVQTGVHYPIPLHLQTAFRYLGYKKNDFPVAENIASKVLSLPIFPEMTQEQFEHVCKSISDFFDSRRA